MGTVFTSSALDKVKHLDVTRQSGLVVTNAKANFDDINIKTLLEKIRNNPREILDILGRLRDLRFDSPSSLLAALKAGLLSDVDYERQNAIARLTDRLNGILKDRALIGNMSYNDMLKLTELMGGIKTDLLLKFKDASSEGGYGYYPYGAASQADIDALANGYMALYPDAEIVNIDTVGTAAVQTQLVTTAASIGAEAVIRDIIASTTDPVIKAALIAAVLDTAMAKANITLMTAMLDDTTTYGLTIEQLKGMFPEWRLAVLSNYTETPGVSLADALTAFTAFMSRMNNSENGGWWLVKRVTTVGVTNIPDLSLFQKASADIRKLFMLSEVLRVPTMIADSYPAVDILENYKTTHPMVLVL